MRKNSWLLDVLLIWRAKKEANARTFKAVCVDDELELEVCSKRREQTWR